MLTQYGKVIRGFRIKKELSLFTVAKQLDVSSAFLSGMETGRKELDMSIVAKMMDIMELNDEEKEQVLKAAHSESQ